MSSKKVRKSTKKIGDRDGWRCGIHDGGCGKKVPHHEATKDHIVPRNVWSKLEKHPTSQGNYQIMCPDCNHNKKKSKMSGSPNFVCGCHHLYATDCGDMEIWHKDNNQWIRLCVLWKGDLNNTDDTLMSQKAIVTRASINRWLPVVGDGTGVIEGAAFSPPGPMRFQVKKYFNMRQLFRVGRCKKTKDEFTDFMSDYEASGEICVGQTKDHPLHPTDLNLQSSVSFVRPALIWQPSPCYAYEMLINIYAWAVLSDLRVTYGSDIYWALRLPASRIMGLDVRCKTGGYFSLRLPTSEDMDKIDLVVQKSVKKVLRDGDKDLEQAITLGVMCQVLRISAFYLEHVTKDISEQALPELIADCRNHLSFLKHKDGLIQSEIEQVAVDNPRNYRMVLDGDGSGGWARRHWKAVRRQHQSPPPQSKEKQFGF